MFDLLLSPNSLFYWYPRIPKDIPTPKTILVPVELDTLYKLIDNHEPLPISIVSALITAGREVDYPLFLRTDLISGKHNWEKTCFVSSVDVLLRHAYTVTEETFMPMLSESPQGFVVRELLKPYGHCFTAFFEALPIGTERRYFVENGKVLCHHPYWPEDAIKNPSVPDWKERLKEMSIEDDMEVEELGYYASRVSEALPEHTWSIDFMLHSHGWALIDMAIASQSWHPEHA